MSGYYLYQGTSLERFPEQFPDLFLQDHPLASPVYIIVQNRGLGEWLVRSLARRTGSVMGPQILMPEQALRQFAGGFPAARKIVNVDGEGRGLLFMDGMKLAVYKAIEEAIAGKDSLYAELRRYAEAGGKRLWQLSDALAGIFYHYGMNCLPLVEAWEQGRVYPGLSTEYRFSESWQQGLWKRIFHEGSPYTHLSRVLAQVMASGDRYDGPEARVVLFGSMFLGETGLKFFRYLARSLNVSHFIFTPTELFSAKASNPSQSAGPSVPATLFLKENARLSSDFASLIPQLQPEKAVWFGQKDSPNNFLDKIRSSLIADKALDTEIEDDGSLAIHDVTGIRRQVEVLKDRILEALRDDETLAPTEIGVLAPDIASYAPYIETIFPGQEPDGRDSITYNLSDLPMRSEAPYPDAFNRLLELPGSRFGRSTFTGLFDNPCFLPVASDPDIAETWKYMADALNVRWGLDTSHRQELGAADPGTGSWERAFNRLLAAYYYDEEDNPDLLPAELEGNSEAQAAGQLMRTIHTLDTDLRVLDREYLNLREWTLRWERIIDSWLRPRPDNADDEADRLRIKGSIRDLMALDEDLAGLSDFNDQGISWSAFSALLKEMANPAGGRKGRYLARGVTCASLKPMRAIPFRRIYVLGLDEGSWPGREFLTGFDLREEVEKTIDLSREAVDRFAFLETLYAARDHLSFFYNGRDAERGDPLSPASPLAEFCDYLGSGWERLLRVHPLVPYTRESLGDDERLATSSTDALALAKSIVRGASPAASADPGLPEENDNEVIDWKDLAGFLKNPIQYYFRDVLGVSGASSVADDDEHDILEYEFLDWWNWKNEAISENPGSLRDSEELLASFHRRLSLEGAVADTPVAGLSSQRLSMEVESLALQYQRILAEGFSETQSFSVILDPVIRAPEGSTLPGKTLRIPSPIIESDDGSTLTVTGRIGGLRLLSPESWTLIEFVHGNQLHARHQINAWLKVMLLSAYSASAGIRELRVFRLGGRDFPARRYYFDSAAMSDSEAGDPRLLGNPEETLKVLAKVRKAGRLTPMYLHPDLADDLYKLHKKGGLEPAELPGAASKAWYGRINNQGGFSQLKACSYRSRFVSDPHFEDSVFREFWESVYRDGGLL